MGSNTVDISDSSNPNAPFKRTRSHFVFRLLCHASRVGAFIGKSGSAIKSLQQLCDAKIRVDNAPMECPERVIVIVIKLDEGHDGGEVPKATEALLKVFERILDVAAAESEGTEEVGDRVVSCRLLANGGQAGSVIGKGGKVVEKIRSDTGCRIRVLNDKLPVCIKPSDEIIEIQGTASSVKKALIAIAGRLQGPPPPPDRTKMMGTRPNEVSQRETSDVPHEGLTDPNMDCHLQQTSALSTSPIRSDVSASKVHPLSAEANRVSALDPEALQLEVTFRILCSSDRIDTVIGKDGSTLKTLQNETGAGIIVGPPVFECEDRLITVTALENPESRFSPAQKAVVLIFCRSVEGSVEKGLDLRSYKGPPVTARLVVPSNQVGVLLGKAGAIVSEIRKATWTNIRVIGNGQVPKCASYNDFFHQISGDFPNVQDALYKATSRLRDNFFAIAQNTGGAGIYRRPSDSVPSSLGGTPVVGANRDLNVHSLSQSIDHLTLSRNLDRSSGTGVWTPKTVGGINSGFPDDVSRRWTPHKGGLDLGSGIATSVVTNTTVELMVPNNIISRVYGENGNNLNQLRQISGAKVTIHEAHPGTSNGTTIVLSGTPDETQAAQSLLQAFIINGS
ncbi:KH domain-containing protein HEN4-like [Vicia villosa]|uniref:KH domain-containing protein HEN4-like n=1 Tax=Vicia villosa TaxID=3911 RepID=UPI00273C3289|nr:KH domain-containing protein HEN4-like [Vicia villosa]